MLGNLWLEVLNGEITEAATLPNAARNFTDFLSPVLGSGVVEQTPPLLPSHPPPQ